MAHDAPVMFDAAGKPIYVNLHEHDHEAPCPLRHDPDVRTVARNTVEEPVQHDGDEHDRENDEDANHADKDNGSGSTSPARSTAPSALADPGVVPRPDSFVGGAGKHGLV